VEKRDKEAPKKRCIKAPKLPLGQAKPGLCRKAAADAKAQKAAAKRPKRKALK